MPRSVADGPDGGEVVTGNYRRGAPGGPYPRVASGQTVPDAAGGKYLGGVSVSTLSGVIALGNNPPHKEALPAAQHGLKKAGRKTD
ncbi:hypothetical protein GCM10007350_20500 [Jeongeupia chitinilytica]|uniref:Uncharacterized protein n=1 Tax=Jeongeupia chitinilytica TaxID=1041641 RepID=A0ABQ3GZV3_9NEIS|nr:hypothetical protein GCM10007350_20500 [Jeongeupia chitinilytica]